MQDEYDALMTNDTWTLVPPPLGANIVNGNGYFATNITPMDLLLVIRLVG